MNISATDVVRYTLSVVRILKTNERSIHFQNEYRTMNISATDVVRYTLGVVRIL